MRSRETLKKPLPNDRRRSEGASHIDLGLSGLQGDNEHILVDLDAGTYNMRKATCSYYCISCDGAVNAVIGQPIDFLVAAQQPLSFLELQNTGQTYNYPWDAAWSSDDTYVASIDQNGMASGVSEGTFNAGAYASSALIYNPHYCAYNASCPAQGALENTSGGSVNACVTPDGETTSPIRQTLIYPYTPTTTDYLQTLIAKRGQNELRAQRSQNHIRQPANLTQRMVLRYTLLQRQIAEHPILYPLVSTHKQ